MFVISISFILMMTLVIISECGAGGPDKMRLNNLHVMNNSTHMLYKEENVLHYDYFNRLINYNMQM